MKQYFFYVGLIFLIGEELLYNTVLVSAIHQHEKQLFWGKKKNPTLQNYPGTMDLESLSSLSPSDLSNPTSTHILLLN